MANVMGSDNKLSQVEKGLLFAILADGRSFFSRREYDRLHKLVNTTTHRTLYDAWKEINRQLVSLPVLAFPFGLPSGTAREIQFSRQFTGFFTKLEASASSDLSLTAMWGERVRNARASLPRGDLDFARSLVRNLLGPAPLLRDLLPHHGPGSVATGEKGTEKSSFTSMYRQLLPHGGVDLAHLNDNHWLREPYCLELVEHPITKVVTVPKDQYKRRIISEEPLLMQFLQQGVMRYLVARIESRTGSVQFTDQNPNRSRTLCFLSDATLDMSDASDTVSRRIVRQIMPDDWWSLLSALRSHFARLPDGTLVPLRCFAPMGSALCFPIEAIVFWVCTLCALKRSGFNRSYRDSVLVYGDDIVVPLASAEFVIRYLRDVGFRPNTEKCCYKTGFRESCGSERYNGHDVSVIRPKTISFRGIRALPMVEYANRFYRNGFVSTATFIASNYDNIVALNASLDVLGHPDLPWRKKGHTRWNPNYQRLEQQHFSVKLGGERDRHATGYKHLFMVLTNGWTTRRVPNPSLTGQTRWIAVRPLDVR